ncbi:MAG: hypothetical protein HY069_04115, partial [Chlamydiia bacterium]|nr:hypothetical protein [Chlamydiia bacterium]
MRVVHDQNYIQLASIQSVSLGLPASTVGWILAEQHGPSVAICSILVGNLMLWLIAMAIISMAFEGRSNAIENARSYLGKYGAFFMAFVLLLAFLNWYVLQINASVPLIGRYFQIEDRASIVRIGVGLGFLTALLSVDGIRIIKWATTATLPAILAYYVYAMIESNVVSHPLPSWGLSLSAILYAILIFLPGIVNLPTFFRHAKTRANGYLALTLMTLLISFFEIAPIWMRFNGSELELFGFSSVAFIAWT